MVPPTSRISRPPNSATLGLRRIRFSTGIGRVKSPRRERPSSEAFDGVLGRAMEVVPERLTASILASEPPESASQHNVAQLHTPAHSRRGKRQRRARYLSGARAARPRYSASSPRACSMRSSWLYLATRSLRAGAPVLIWPQLVATARSAMVASSVSPDRWLITEV